MLMVLLDNCYDPQTHSFASLTDNDRLVAYIFRSLDIVEVHPAYFTRKTTIMAVEDDAKSSTNGLPRLTNCMNIRAVNFWSTEHCYTGTLGRHR